MGKRAGVRIVLLESGYETARFDSATVPDYLLADLRELAELLYRRQYGQEESRE